MAWKGGNAGWGNQWGQQSAAAAPSANQWGAAQKGGAQSWQAGAQVRPAGLIGGKGVAVSPPVAATDTLVVSTGGTGMDEVVIRTLVGEYTEHGTNHGRKVYKKAALQAGGDAVDVFLYYWDSRDGDAFEGWWFGNQLGGTQVWSHVKNAAMTPPASGWKIPWDGGIRAQMSVQPKANAAMNAAAKMK
jgi:hypothetical protein